MDGGYDEFREDGLVASYVSKIAELSFKFECDRGENLRIYADKLLLSISMLSVAFVTPLEYIVVSLVAKRVEGLAPLPI